VFEYTSNPDYLDKNWEVVRGYDDFVDLIACKFMENKLPRLISLDHDLVNEHYILAVRDLHNFDENLVNSPTGYHALLWYYNFCTSEDIVPAKIMVHSKNPGGRKNILSLIEQYNLERNG
jgi:predicted alpha/beta-fold hydrolase